MYVTLMTSLRGIYRGLCINCGGSITDERLLWLGLCHRCLSGELKVRNWFVAEKILKRDNKLKNAERIYGFFKETRDFALLFRRAVGSRMWALQENWARRALLKRSFSIVAPTGVGKTVFGIVMALYYSSRRGKSFIVVPTSILVNQVYERINMFIKRAGLDVKVSHYHGSLSNKARKEELERIRKGDFDVLIATDRFIINHFDLLVNIKFDFVFVDDIDSFLKSPKNIDRVLVILGFSNEVIQAAMNILVLRREERRLAKIGGDTASIHQQIEKNRNMIWEFKSQNEIGILIVSGATLKSKRTRKIKLFEELLDFQIGYQPEMLRNIKDFFLKEDKAVEETVASIIKRFGGGCLIFVPMPKGREYAEKINSFLLKRGIRSRVFWKEKEEAVNEFLERKCDALIGVASYRSPLARGIDLPERIRYVIFAGVPRMELPLSWKENNPVKILTLIRNIRDFLDEKQKLQTDRIISSLKKITPLPRDVREKITKAIEEGTRLAGFEEYVRNVIVDAREFLKKSITEEVIDKIRRSETASVKEVEGEFVLTVADPIAYIQ
ncbi:DEAD/DEAH box helicase, partial [Candidatus Bathyarchaeota archaeon]